MSKRFFRPAGLPAPAWEHENHAFDLIRARLHKLDTDRERNGLPALIDMDLTLKQRAAQVSAVLSGPQDGDTVETAAALLAGALMNVVRAEGPRPDLGDAA